ncbi:MAG: ATP-grasp domain-containing protein [Dehalococcoidales bacterium]
MNKTINVLLTAIGAPGGPSVIQSLRENKDIRITGTDMRDYVLSKYLVDAFYTVPSGRSEEYIKNIKQIVKQEDVKVILPAATYELNILSRHKNELRDIGTEVCVSDEKGIDIANNKFLLYEHFKNENFVPRYYSPSNFAELEESITKLGFPEKRTVIKPFVSHGSIGFRIIDDSLDLSQRYWEEKPNSTYINSEILKLIFKDNSIQNLLATEYLSGAEYGVDLFIDPVTHKALCGIVRNNGEVFHSEVSFGELVDAPELLKTAIRIAEELKLSYCINLDFKLDDNNEIKLLEINPRMPATAFLGTSIGINFPLMSVQAALGETPTFNNELKGNNSYKIFSYRGFAVTKDGAIIKHVIQ